MSSERAALVLAAIVLGFGFYCATHSVDFPVYHRVAAQVLRGDYELYPNAIYASGGAVPSHDFRYAPAMAFLFVPLGFLPLRAAAFLFFLLKVVAVIYIGRTALRYVGSTPDRALILISLLLAAGYVIEEFHYGNFHFFCIALMVYAFDSVESGHVVRPAVALGIAIAAKLTPILLLGYFAWRRRVAACAATVVVLLLIAILPALVVGYPMNNHLLEGFGKYALEKIDESDNYALRGMLMRAGLSLAAATWVWAVTALVGSIAVVALLWPKPVGRATRFLELSIVVLAMLLASPHAQRRYFIAVYVPVLALLALLKRDENLPEAKLIRLALGLIAAAGTALPLLFGGPALSQFYQAWSPHVVGPLVLLVALVLVTKRMKSVESATGGVSIGPV